MTADLQCCQAVRLRVLITAHLPLCLGFLLLSLGAGCGLLRSAADLPGQTVHAVTGTKEKKPADPVEVQQMLLRFADEYSMRIIIGVDKLQHGTNSADPAEILKWKTALVSSTCSIVSGPNPIANLLDMTIFVTVTRMAFEEDWKPNLFGDSAETVLDSARLAEEEIWRLANTILTPEQQAELRRGIQKWHDENSHSANVLAARAVGFATQIASTHKEDAKPGSVFGLLGVDPLSGMDPAVREIAQTRLLAERGLFLAQKMPMLVRWQTEIFSLNTMELPAVQQLVSNSTQISASVERFATIAEKLPEQVSSERAEILKTLQSQEKDMVSLMGAGTQLSDSLNTTIKTLDALMVRFGVGDTNRPSRPPSTNGEPFRIENYTTAATQLEATARQLTELIATLDRTIGSTNLLQLSAQVSPIVNHAFWRGVLLVVVLLSAALIYRFISTRILSATRSKTNPP